MKILLTSIGTRGDIEPFLAIGQILKGKGHEVVYSFPKQFANLVEEGAKFHAFSQRFIELIESPEGKALMGKSSLYAKVRAVGYMYREGMQVNKVLVTEQYEITKQEEPDLIIYNGKCNYPLLWGLKNNKRTVLMSPVPYFIHDVAGSAHVGFGRNLGWLNKVTYHVANSGSTKTIYDAQKMLDDTYQYSKTLIKKTLFKEPLIYAISPSLFQKPNHWNENCQVLGYYDRSRVDNWTPNESLNQFLDNNTNILLITFGSMVNSFPKKVSKMIYQTIDELGYSVIINTAAGGLVRMDDFATKENFHFTENIPYDWILPKVDAIIHHGGSGTTHTGLKYGLPTLLVPHIIDQYSWNQLIDQLGAGPKGISINKIRKPKFKKLVHALMTDHEYRTKASQIAQQMSKENNLDKLYDFIIDKSR